MAGAPYAPLDWLVVARQRAGSGLGDPLIYRAQVDSTNILAATLVAAGTPPGTVVVADAQTAGRGRLGRRWVATPGSALTFTAVLHSPAAAWTLPLATGLAIVETLVAQGITANLKWPNDVLIEGRKCGGILIEAKRLMDATWLLVGIGINVRDADPSLPNATCLDAHSVQRLDRESLLAGLLERLEEWYARAEQDAAAVRSAWRARLVTLGERVTVRGPKGIFNGVAIDVAADGALIVQLAGGATYTVRAGDVTLAG